MIKHFVLDLRENGNLSISDLRWLANNQSEALRKYNEFIKKLIVNNNLKDLDLLVKVLSRNPYQTNILNYICKLDLLKYKLENNSKINKILIDDSQFEKPVRNLYSKYCDEKLIIVSNSKNKNIYLKIFFNLIKTIYGFCNDYFWSHLYLSKKLPTKRIIALDTFIMKQYFNKNGLFFDRYYSGYSKYLTASQLEKIWYFPVISNTYSVRDYYQIFSRIKKSKSKFILQESLLNFFDYLQAIIISFKISQKITNIPDINDISIANIIREECLSEIFSFSIVKTINRYKFFRKLKEKNIQIEGIINWNENQPIDKAFNLGSKKYYPEVDVKGYQGFIVSEYYACAIPLKLELDLKVLPTSYNVLSSSSAIFSSEVVDSIEISSAPAFRFSHLFDIERCNDKVFKILFLMPISIIECKKLISLYLDFIQDCNPKVQLLVKIHPTMSTQYFFRNIPKSKRKDVIVTNRNTEELYTEISLLVSMASSACTEAFSIGIPVAIYGNNHVGALNPIPNSHINSYHKVFYTIDELNKFIKKIIFGLKVDTVSIFDFFIRANQENTRDFFNFDKKRKI